MTHITIESHMTSADWKARMDAAWQEVARHRRPAGGVRNCPSDLQAEDMAMRSWQGARFEYLEACKQEGIDPA